MIKKTPQRDSVLALLIARKRHQATSGSAPAVPFGHPGFDFTAWTREQEAIREQQQADKVCKFPATKDDPPNTRRKRKHSEIAPEQSIQADDSRCFADASGASPESKMTSNVVESANVESLTSSTTSPYSVPMVMPVLPVEDLKPLSRNTTPKRAPPKNKERVRSMPFSLTSVTATPSKQAIAAINLEPPFTPTTVTQDGLAHVVGNVSAVKQARSWLGLSRSARPCLLLEGPTGCGKSFLAQALARELHLNVIQIDSENIHCETSYVGLIIKTATTARKAGCCVIADDVDVHLALRPEHTLSAERRALNDLAILRDSNPVILTCTDLSDAHLREFANNRSVKCIKMNPVYEPEMIKFLGTHCKRKSIVIPQARMVDLAQFARGDLHQMFAGLVEFTQHRKQIAEQRTHEMDFFQGATALLQHNPLQENKTGVAAKEQQLALASLEGHVADNTERATFTLEHNVPILLNAWSAQSHARSVADERARQLLPLLAMTDALDVLSETDVLGTLGWNSAGVHDIQISRVLSTLGNAYHSLPCLSSVRVKYAYPASMGQYFQVRQAQSTAIRAGQDNARRAASLGNTDALQHAFLSTTDVLETTSTCLHMLDAALSGDKRSQEIVDCAATVLACHTSVESAKAAATIGAFRTLNVKSVLSQYERGSKLLMATCSRLTSKNKPKKAVRKFDKPKHANNADALKKRNVKNGLSVAVSQKK